MNPPGAVSVRPTQVIRSAVFIPRTGARSFDCIQASAPIPVRDVMPFRHGTSALVQKHPTGTCASGFRELRTTG